MSINQNPESTWGKTPDQKEAWVKKFAPETEESTTETPNASLDSKNPESTWGKTVEEKLEFFETNVEGFDPTDPTGHPTAVGVDDPELFEDRPATRNTLDSGPAAYSADDRPIEYRPIYVSDGEQDFTAPSDAPTPSNENTQPQTPPVDDVPVTSEPNYDSNDPEPEVAQPTETVDPQPATETDGTPDYTDSTVPDSSQPGPAPADAPPVDMPTVDGQENTANESSTTGGADVSQSSQPDVTVQTPLYEGGTPESPVADTNDSAADTPGANASEVREAASNRGRAKRAAGGVRGGFERSDSSGVVEDFSVDKQ